jgi:hypothetical protein
MIGIYQTNHPVKDPDGVRWCESAGVDLRQRKPIVQSGSCPTPPSFMFASPPTFLMQQTPPSDFFAGIGTMFQT